jgi:hypothetical protein
MWGINKDFRWVSGLCYGKFFACEKSTKKLGGKVGSKVVLRNFWHVWGG